VSTPSREQLRARHEQRLRLLVPAELSELRTLSLFSGIPEKARDKVVDKVRKYLHVLPLGAGEVVLREGDYSDSAYFLIAGEVEVELGPARPERPVVRGGAHVPSAPARATAAEAMIGRTTSIVLADVEAALQPGQRKRLPAGEIFGEMAALSRYPVSATVRAASDVRLLQIRLPGLRMLLATSKDFKKFLDERYRERALARHLRSVPLFEQVDDAVLEELKARAELQSFEPGALVVQEGAPVDSFYLVRGGHVKVAVRVGASDLAVTYLRKGDFAGEAGLLLEEPWPFTLQALEHVELVKLARDDFEAVLGRYPDVREALWAEMVARLKARGAVTRHPVASEYVQMAMETGLVHGDSVLLIDLSTCTRCDECVRGCADAHGGVPRFVREGQRYRNWLVPKACYQCTDPVCMMECPTGAITRSVGTLEVTINPETCIGCGNCAGRCPWNNIVMFETEEKRADGKPVELATKCDLCAARPAGPACVQMCPQGSSVRISFKDLQRVTETLR
jgi:CRP-like cAMP-binding protein/Fe-S-cluster-containing dehydrogenase component